MKGDTVPAWFKPTQHIDDNQHAVIIGGGIAGSQIAWHLAERNWQVTIIERHSQLATEASGNKAGAISPKMTAEPSLSEDFYSRCFVYAHHQLQKLREHSHFTSWDDCGVLQLNHSKRESKRWASLKLRNLPDTFLQCLDAEAASEVAGIPLNVGASYFPQGAWVNPASLCHTLCSHKNINLILHTEALSLHYKKRHWSVKDKFKQEIASSRTIILANGKDIQQFEQTESLPFTSVLGQTTQGTSSQHSEKLRTVIGHKGYLTPQINGQHIFGATFERGISEAKLKKAADEINLLQLKNYLPTFAKQLGSISSSHAAIRMTTPDRFPYVGAMPNREYYQTHYHDIAQGKHWKSYPDAQYQTGLFVFAGHASRGITTTGLTADYLASLICNETFSAFPTKIKNALHVARFDIRQLKKS